MPSEDRSARQREPNVPYNEHLNFHIGTSESISWSELSEEGVFSIWKSITKSSALYSHHFYVWIYALWNICSSKLCVKWAELRRKTTMQYFINYNFCRTTAAVLAVHKFWLWLCWFIVLNQLRILSKWCTFLPFWAVWHLQSWRTPPSTTHPPT